VRAKSPGELTTSSPCVMAPYHTGDLVDTVTIGDTVSVHGTVATKVAMHTDGLHEGVDDCAHVGGGGGINACRR
jgi:hypothetical protein